MVIGGIQKNSLIDFPSKISCVLFTVGCNFECPYCHNPDLVHHTAGNAILDKEEIFDFLKKRKSLLEGVVITGGEPTLQPDIFRFCQEIKTMGYHIKIDTNGTRPKVLQHLLSHHLIDYIAMDIKTSIDRYSPVIVKNYDIADIKESISIILHSGLAHEFRTTCIKSIIDTTAILEISRLIKGADCYALQNVNLEGAKVLHPEYFDGNDCRLKNNDMKSFQAIAADFVKTVIIR